MSKSLGKTKIWGLPFSSIDQRIPVPIGVWWPVPQTGSDMRPLPSSEPGVWTDGFRKDQKEGLGSRKRVQS